MPDADDLRWIRRALGLASLSLGRTWPNPGVAAVVVRDGVLLGQGRHERCGREHAEVLAIADARAHGHDVAGATVYVTLAPCTKHGRQPPCVDALRAARVGRVVAAVADPMQADPAALLGAAGIAYAVGVGARAATHLHGGFLSRIMRGQPRVTGKWAMTLDGCIAADGGDSRWISGPEALALARRRRRAFDAIVVGAGTARRDDPGLAASRPRLHGDEPGPLRVVIAADGRLDPASQLARTARTQPVLVVATRGRADAAALAALGVGCIEVDDAHDPAAVCAALGRHGLNDVLVEGGAQVHGAWLRAGCYDRLEVYLGARSLGGGLGAALGPGVGAIADGGHWIHEQPPRAFDDGTVLLRLGAEAS